MATKTKTKLSSAEQKQLIQTLKSRFEKNMKRHKGIDWDTVAKKLEASSEKCRSLIEMERTGGEPDVVGQDKKPVKPDGKNADQILESLYPSQIIQTNRPAKRRSKYSSL